MNMPPEQLGPSRMEMSVRGLVEEGTTIEGRRAVTQVVTWTVRCTDKEVRRWAVKEGSKVSRPKDAPTEDTPTERRAYRKTRRPTAAQKTARPTDTERLLGQMEGICCSE